MSEDSPEKASLGQQAFTVICDVAARDATVKNKAIRAANDGLVPLEEEMFSLQILKSAAGEKSIVFQCDARSHEEDNEEEAVLLAYGPGDDEEIEFPLNDLPRLQFQISGVTVDTGSWFGKTPKLFIDHECGDIHIRVDYSTHIHIKGKVKNYGGNLQDIQRLIDSNRISLYWRSMAMAGMRDTRTGQPLRFAGRFSAMGEGYLDNAIFRFEDIKVAKTLLNPLLALSTPNVRYLGPNDEKELKDLSEVMRSHKGIHQASADWKTLNSENQRLLRIRGLFQRFSMDSPEGTFNFSLENGRGGTFCNGGYAAWTMESSAETTMHLTSVKKICPMLSCIASGRAFGQHELTEDGLLLVVPYGRGIEAVFTFDRDSLEALDINEIRAAGLHAHVDATLMNQDGYQEEVGPNMFAGFPQVRIATADGQPVRPLSELKVRLLWVSIRLEMVQRRLELLGIDTSDIKSVGEEDDASDGGGTASDEE